jgi:hypothetical protein
MLWKYSSVGRKTKLFQAYQKSQKNKNIIAKFFQQFSTDGVKTKHLYQNC